MGFNSAFKGLRFVSTLFLEVFQNVQGFYLTLQLTRHTCAMSCYRPRSFRTDFNPEVLQAVGQVQFLKEKKYIQISMHIMRNFLSFSIQDLAFS